MSEPGFVHGVAVGKCDSSSAQQCYHLGGSVMCGTCPVSMCRPLEMVPWATEELASISSCWGAVECHVWVPFVCHVVSHPHQRSLLRHFLCVFVTVLQCYVRRLFWGLFWCLLWCNHPM